jgi:hypothetical protein
MDWKEEALRATPGLLGSLVALRWIGGTPWQVAAALVGGGAGAYYGTPHVVEWLNVNPGLGGFLLGLFGMAIASRVFDAIAGLRLDELVRAITGGRK